MGFGDSWSTFLRRMPLFLQYYMLLLPLAMSMVAVVDSGRKLPPIYWNATNSMFHTSSPNNIDISVGDTIDVICPQYPPHTSITDMEYYTIYMVNRTAYESCIINDTTKLWLLLNCSNPSGSKRLYYTLIIRPFQSIPGNPDFQRGENYYFITTSGGTHNSLDNQYKGACEWKNMRMVLNVMGGGHTKPTTSKYDTTHTPPKTTPWPHTTPRPTTTRTTTTTTVITTTTTAQRTTPRRGPTHTDRIPGDRIPDVNVIHVKGPKNTGLISDSAGHRTSLSMASLIVSVLLAHLFR